MTQKRNVTWNQNIIALNLNGPEKTTMTRKINEDTWCSRYSKIISPEGYNTGSRGSVIKSIGPEEWIEYIRQLMPVNETIPKAIWHLDGLLLRSASHVTKKFVDFYKMVACSHIETPINYYALDEIYNVAANDSSNKINKNKLFDLLRKLNFNLMQREVIKVDDISLQRAITEFKNQQAEGKPLQDCLRASLGSQREHLDSLAPEFIINLYENTFLAPNERKFPILIVTRDPLLLPVIKRLRRSGFSISLGLLPNHNISNYYMNHFDRLVRFGELLHYLNITSPLRPRQLQVNELQELQANEKAS